MNHETALDSIHKKLKASPHWRDDFKIEEVKDSGGISVYYIKANDQDQSTILAIAKLNEMLES